MDADKIISYLQRRYRSTRIYQQVSTPEGKPYTFEDAHSCYHCDKICLQLIKEYEPFTCFDCLEICYPDETHDDDIYPCPRCGRETNTLEHMKVEYSATLDYGLQEAVEAAADGCILYRTILDATCKNLEEVSKEWEHPEVMHELIGDLRFEIIGYTWLSDINTIGKFSLRLIKGKTKEVSAQPDLGLQGWATSKDEVAEYIQARPYERNVVSATSQQFARNCLQTYMKEHPECQRNQFSPFGPEQIGLESLPSRLLDARPAPDGSEVRVVDVKKLGNEDKASLTSRGYMTLSYCWGGDQPVKLTKSSLVRLQSGIALSSLPQTLQDAVWVARMLELKHLWIDCLCIIQDDATDKAQQISLMSKFYDAATLTLSAASSASCTTGFLHERAASTFAIGPIKLRLRQQARSMGHMHLVQETSAPSEPIATRAWSYQESLLARRLLIYADRQLFWTCASGFAECGGTKRAFVQRLDFGIPSLVSDIYPVSVYQAHPSYVMWDKIVAQYTTRRLGFADDKLPAIAAIAERLVEMWRARGTVLTYKAGLLVDTESDMCGQLLWRSVGEGVSRPSIFRAPSWSWASVEGCIQPHFYVSDHQYQVEVTVESWHVVPTLAQAPYGQLKSGELRILTRARAMRHVKMQLPSHSILWDQESDHGEKVLSPVYRSDEALCRKAPKGRLLLCPDTEQDRASIQTALDSAEGTESVLVVPFMKATSELANPKGVHGLVVAQANSVDAFVRLGRFTIDYNQGWEIFQDVPQKVLCIS